MTAARFGHCDACARYHLLHPAGRTLWLCVSCFVRHYCMAPEVAA